MAKTEPDLQNKIRSGQRYGGAAAGVFHRIQRARRIDHAKSESAKSVPRQFEHERRRLHGVGEKEQGELHGPRRGEHPETGHRHAGLAVRDTAHDPVHIRHFRRIVERPDWSQETHSAAAHFWRAHAHFGTVGVRHLLLRTAHGSRRSGRIRAVVVDGRLDDHVHGRVHVHRGRDLGGFYWKFD